MDKLSTDASVNTVGNHSSAVKGHHSAETISKRYYIDPITKQLKVEAVIQSKQTIK